MSKNTAIEPNVLVSYGTFIGQNDGVSSISLEAGNDIAVSGQIHRQNPAADVESGASPAPAQDEAPPAKKCLFGKPS